MGRDPPSLENQRDASADSATSRQANSRTQAKQQTGHDRFLPPTRSPQRMRWCFHHHGSPYDHRSMGKACSLKPAITRRATSSVAAAGCGRPYRQPSSPRGERISAAGVPVAGSVDAGKTRQAMGTGRRTSRRVGRRTDRTYSPSRATSQQVVMRPRGGRDASATATSCSKTTAFAETPPPVSSHGR